MVGRPSSELDYQEIAAKVVSAYVVHNTLSPGDLPKLLAETYGQLRALANCQAVEPAKPAAPAVPVNRSISAATLTCLECGKSLRSMRRHIKAEHGLSPLQYIRKWGLPYDYPMVSPDYSKARSEVARRVGLGGRNKRF